MCPKNKQKLKKERIKELVINKQTRHTSYGTGLSKVFC